MLYFFLFRFFHTFREDQDREERRQIIEDVMADRENGDWLLRFNTSQTEYVLVVRYDTCDVFLSSARVYIYIRVCVCTYICQDAGPDKDV